MEHFEREFDVYGAEDFVFRKNTDGLLDVYIYLPPYIDIRSAIYIDIVGYAIFGSPFGEFAKRIVVRTVSVTPDMWRE